MSRNVLSVRKKKTVMVWPQRRGLPGTGFNNHGIQRDNNGILCMESIATARFDGPGVFVRDPATAVLTETGSSHDGTKHPWEKSQRYSYRTPEKRQGDNVRVDQNRNLVFVRTLSKSLYLGGVLHMYVYGILR